MILFQDFAAGGTERIMIRLANRWARRRRVTILCGFEGGPAREAVGQGVAVIELSPAIPRSPLSRLRLGRAMADLLPVLNPDVIVLPGNHMLPALSVMPRTATPIVCKLSNPLVSGMPERLGKLVRAPVCGWLAERLTAIVAMSHNLGSELRQDLPEYPITVIAEPILDDRPPSPRSAQGAGRALVFVGRLVPQKNVELAIQALLHLPSDFTLRIVGDGPERARLEGLVQRLALSGRVRFAGHVRDVSSHLAASDIFLLPSRYEGYPAAAVEALAAGLPIVATACSTALPEIISHPSMGRVADADPWGFATAINQLARGPAPDPASIEQLVSRHRLSACADRWLAELDHVVGRARHNAAVRE